MSDTPARPAKKLQSFDDDDIVRYSVGLDVPIVGMVRNRNDYKEMREISLIFGYTLGMHRPRATDAATPGDDASAAAHELPAASGKGPSKAARQLDPANAQGETGENKA